MAGFTERVSILIDVTTQRAGQQLAQFKTKLSEAEGGFNKLKVAGGAAFDAITKSPAALAGAASAVVAFATTSIKKFEETALAAGKFSDATGLSVDEASRWIEVAGDVGISTDTLQTAFGRMEKAIASNRQAFGDLVVTAKDGSVDLNATFLNVIKRLQGIKDPIERANEASKLFGRGFQSLAEILGTSADDLKDRLAAVSEQKVINEDELDKARKLREAMDNLNDVFEDVQIQVGQALVPALTQVADSLAALEGAAKTGNKALEPVGISLGDIWHEAEKTFNPLEKVTSFFTDPVWGKGKDNVVSLKDAIKDTGQGAGIFSATLPPVTEQTKQLGDAAGTAALKVGVLAKGFQSGVDIINAALGRLDLEDQVADTAKAIADMKEKSLLAFDAAKKGASDAKDKQAAYDQSVRDTQRSLFNMLAPLAAVKDGVNGIPASKVTSIKADIDSGSYERALNRLEILSRNRTADLFIVTHGGAGYGTSRTGARAGGGPVQKGMPYIVGEKQAELFVPDQNGTVVPSVPKTWGAPTNVTIINPVGTNPSQVAAQINRYAQRNGTRR